MSAGGPDYDDRELDAVMGGADCGHASLRRWGCDHRFEGGIEMPEYSKNFQYRG